MEGLQQKSAFDIKLQDKERCVIVCASPESGSEYILEEIEPKKDFVICADGGMSHLKRAEIVPDIWVGDFDSWQGEVKSKNSQIVRLNPEKDDTDTISCINKANELGFKKIALLCALGGRTDHTFANLSVLLYGMERGLYISIITPFEELKALKDGEYIIDNQKGKTFSVFAFGCDVAEISYEGTKYPLNHYSMKASYPIGISNIFTNDKAAIKVHRGKVLYIINKYEI